MAEQGTFLGPWHMRSFDHGTAQMGSGSGPKFILGLSQKQVKPSQRGFDRHKHLVFAETVLYSWLPWSSPFGPAPRAI